MCDNPSVSTQPIYTRLGQQVGIPPPRGHRNATTSNWRRRFPAPPQAAPHARTRMAHTQRQNIQNVDPQPRRIHDDPKTRFPSLRTVRPHLGPLTPLRDTRSSNDFHPSFNPPPRFSRSAGPVIPHAAVATNVHLPTREPLGPRSTGPVNFIPHAVPMWTSNIPPTTNVHLPTQELLSPGLSTHSSECSQDVDIPNVLDSEVRGLVDAVLGMLESVDGLEKGLNLLLSQDVSSSKAAFRLASTIAMILHTWRSKANPQSITRLREYLRITSLFKFAEHWKPGGYWEIEAIMPVSRPFSGVARKGMNIASFITSLFIARVISAGDFQNCLDFLIAHPVHFDRLCAMHAMVTQANYRICKAEYWLRTKAFRDRLAFKNLRDPASIWAQDGPSSFFVTDIIATLDRWHCTTVMNNMRRASSLL